MEHQAQYISFDEMEWPVDKLLKSLYKKDMGDAEFVRRLRCIFPLARKNENLMDGIEEALKARGEIFSMRPEQVASQNNLPKVTKQSDEYEWQIDDMISVMQGVAPFISNGRQWYAVYKVMIDRKMVADGDFSGFCDKVKENVSDCKHLPKHIELSRMAQGSFNKSVSMWNESDAPVHGKRFSNYLNIAEKTKELLRTIKNKHH